MRAKEFITEREMPERKSRVMSTAFEFPTMPSSDGYQVYRFGVAMANHEEPPYGPSSQHAVITAYTPEEEEIKQRFCHGKRRSKSQTVARRQTR